MDWYARLEMENGEQQREAYEAILAAPEVDESALAAILSHQAPDAIGDRAAFAYVAQICGHRRLEGMITALVKVARLPRRGSLPWEDGIATVRERIPRYRYPAVGALIQIGTPATPVIIDGLRESCHLSWEEQFMPPWHCAYVLSKIYGEDAAIRKMQEIHATVSDPTEVRAIDQCIADLQDFLRQREQNEAESLVEGRETPQVSPTPQEAFERGTGGNDTGPQGTETSTPAPSENSFSTHPAGGNATTTHPDMTVRPVPRGLRGADTPTATPQPPGSVRGLADPLALLAAGTLLATLVVLVIWLARRRGGGRPGGLTPPLPATSPPCERPPPATPPASPPPRTPPPPTPSG